MQVTEKQFQHLMGAAETFQKLADEPLIADYWIGYMRGLRRKYHGKKFGTDEEHKQWKMAVTSDDESRQRRGMGYIAGWTGLSVETAMKSQTCQ